jgi:hypothetical protein
MKAVVLILALIGIILISVGYVKSNLQCPPPKIEYRYIPKTFDDEQDVHTPVLSIGGMYSMFEDDSPWIQDRSYATTDVKYNQ